MVFTAAATITGALTPTGRRPGADSGDPQVAAQVIESLGNGAVGVWECAPGGWPVVDRTDTEVCYILSGAAVITDESTGTRQEISAGDLLVLPVGWTGRWDVTETIRKVYAIY